jgi:hypothetical protein
LRSLKNVSLLVLNDHFEDKHAEANGLFIRTLIKSNKIPFPK